MVKSKTYVLLITVIIGATLAFFYYNSSGSAINEVLDKELNNKVELAAVRSDIGNVSYNSKCELQREGGYVNVDVLFSIAKVGPGVEYAESFLMNEAKQEFNLEIAGEKFSPDLYHLIRPFSQGQSAQLMLGFRIPGEKFSSGLEEFYLTFHDEPQNNGIVYQKYLLK